MPYRSTLQHAARGLCRLPHVGAHPGLPMAVIILAIGAAAGTQRCSLTDALLGLCSSALWVLPLLVIGSVGRSRLSDRLDTKTRR